MSGASSTAKQIPSASRGDVWVDNGLVIVMEDALQRLRKGMEYKHKEDLKRYFAGYNAVRKEIWFHDNTNIREAFGVPVA